MSTRLNVNNTVPLGCALCWAGLPLASCPPELLRACDAKGRSALHYAAATGSLQGTAYVLERGVNIRLQDALGNSAVHYSLLNNARDVLSLLIRNQAPLNVQNAQGETPLFMAARQGDVNVVSELLRAGANPNIANIEEATPLHIAAACNHTTVMSALMGAGAHVNARDLCQDTPLHWAVREEALGAVQLLLHDQRCDQNARNEDNESARDLAWMLNLSDVLALFPANLGVASFGEVRATPAHGPLAKANPTGNTNNAAVFAQRNLGYV